MRYHQTTQCQLTILFDHVGFPLAYSYMCLDGTLGIGCSWCYRGLCCFGCRRAHGPPQGRRSCRYVYSPVWTWQFLSCLMLHCILAFTCICSLPMSIPKSDFESLAVVLCCSFCSFCYFIIYVCDIYCKYLCFTRYCSFWTQFLNCQWPHSYLFYFIASCSTLVPYEAFLIGMVAAGTCIGGHELLGHMKVDDPAGKTMLNVWKL